MERHGIKIHENGEKLKKEYKYQVLSMSLPNILKIYNLKEIPYKSKYLEVPPKFKEKCKKKLKKSNKKKVGIFWRSNSKFRNKFRNVSIKKIKDLFEIDAEFHSLQKELTYDEVNKNFEEENKIFIFGTMN